MKQGQHQYWRQKKGEHLFRRLVHMASILFLWLYYQYGARAAEFLHLSLNQLIYLCLGFILLLETLRLCGGWGIFGMREYEKKRISAFCWGAIGIALVFLFAPGKAFVIPIICAYALGDPFLGELRRTKLSKILVIILGVIFISAIWWLAHVWLDTPLWTVFIMGPATVAAEWPCFSWVDDNLLMQLVPLVIALVATSIPM